MSSKKSKRVSSKSRAKHKDVDSRTHRWGWYVLGVILTALLSLIVERAWNWYANLNAYVKVDVVDFCIYRTSRGGIPECELELRGVNTFNHSQSLTLEKMVFHLDSIEYRIPANVAPLTIDENRPQNFHITLPGHLVLDRVLKQVQTPNNAIFSLTYRVFEDNKLHMWVGSDSIVTKCTYWQTPFLASIGEGFQSGADMLDVALLKEDESVRDLASIDSTRNVKIFTSPADRSMIKNVGQRVDFSDGIAFQDININTFLRTYGGYYMGLLRQDTTYIDLIPASEFLTSIQPIQQLALLGNISSDKFSSYVEFVYYNFDKSKENKEFEQFSENSQYIVYLVYEHTLLIDDLTLTLNGLGFRVYTEPNQIKTNRAFKYHLMKLVSFLAPDEKLRTFNSFLNENFASISKSIKNDDIIILWPIPFDSSVSEDLVGGLAQHAGIRQIASLGFDCTPLWSINTFAPFSDPIFVYLNFEQSRSLSADSFQVYRREISESDTSKIPTD